MQSQFPSARYGPCKLGTLLFGEGHKLVKLVHNAVKNGCFELYFLFSLSWTHKWKSAHSFLSLGSYLNMYMYHGYVSLKKEHFCLFSLKREHFLPVFTEKRALFACFH